MDDRSQKQLWMDCYRAAMLEVDLSRLQERIREAEAAIEKRKDTIKADSSPELLDLNDALRNLRVLKRELSEPQPVSSSEHIHPELEGTYVAFVSPERRYIAVTDGVCRLLGYGREELLAKRIDDVAAPELQPAVPETFEKYVQQGHLHGEYMLVGKDGRHIPIAYEARVFPDGCMTARWHPLKK